MRYLALMLALAGLAPDGAAAAEIQPEARAAKPAAPAAPAARPHVVFSDLPTFDHELAKSLSNAKDPVVVTSADRITLREIPPRLEKWLAAVDDSGGKIETLPADPAELQPRFIGLLFTLIGAIRQVRELAKAQQYAEARNFDVKIFYRTDNTGDRVVERVEWIRRQR